MITKLLAAFVESDLTPFSASLISQAVIDAEGGSGPGIVNFEFDRFEVEINFFQKKVTLCDVIRIASPSEETLPLADFLAACRLARLGGQ